MTQDICNLAISSFQNLKPTFVNFSLFQQLLTYFSCTLTLKLPNIALQFGENIGTHSKTFSLLDLTLCSKKSSLTKSVMKKTIPLKLLMIWICLSLTKICKSLMMPTHETHFTEKSTQVNEWNESPIRYKLLPQIFLKFSKTYGKPVLKKKWLSMF